MDVQIVTRRMEVTATDSSLTCIHIHRPCITATIREDILCSYQARQNWILYKVKKAGY